MSASDASGSVLIVHKHLLSVDCLPSVQMLIKGAVKDSCAFCLAVTHGWLAAVHLLIWLIYYLFDQTNTEQNRLLPSSQIYIPTQHHLASLIVHNSFD